MKWTIGKASRALGCATLAALLCSAGALAQQPQNNPYASRPEPSAQGRLEDLAAFRTKFLAVDKSYSTDASAEAEKRVAALEAQAATISEPAFELELARIVALADNGHTHYVLGSIIRWVNRAPIRMTAMGDNFYVVRAEDTQADLLGAKLVSIDGHSIDELRKAGRELWGGLAPYRDKFANNLFESPELLYASHLARAGDAATYVFQTPDGKTVERKLAGEAATEDRPFANPFNVMLPAPLLHEDAHWRTALTADKAPWSLRDGGEPFRWRAAPELNAIVIDMRQNQDSPDHKIADALKTFTLAINDAKPANIILDMRGNGGGNLNTTRDFVQSLPKLATNRVFVLTSPLTFSAAISSVGYLKQAGGDRVSIVGEPVGDRLMFWAEGRGADLPNSHGQIGLATQRHDYATGCKPYKDCHISVIVKPITVASLAPDIAAPWTIEAYLAGRDPAMEAIAAALK